MKEIFVGNEFQEEFSFTQEDVNLFIKVSGDSNPIHHDTEYVSKTIFKKPVVHGLFGASIFSKIIGTDFPGEGSIYLSQDLKFHKPIYIDVKYIAKVEVIKIEEERDRIYLDTTIVEMKDNQLVTSGQAIVKYQLK